MTFRSYWQWFQYRFLSGFAVISCSLLWFGIPLGILLAVITSFPRNQVKVFWDLYGVYAFAVGAILFLFWLRLWLPLAKRLREWFARDWNMCCAICSRSYEWEQYQFREQHGKCYWCTHEPILSVATEEASEPTSLVFTSPADDNPYAPPQGEHIPRIAKPFQFVPPAKPGQVKLTPLNSILFIISLIPGFAVAGVFLFFGMILKTLYGFYWNPWPNPNLPMPDWYKESQAQERRDQWRALGIIVSLTVLFFLLIYWLTTLEEPGRAPRGPALPYLIVYFGFGFAFGIACLVYNLLPLAWRTSPARSFYVVPFDPHSKTYRLIVQWPADANFTEVPKLQFRTASPSGVVLRAYDSGAEGLLLNQTFPHTHETWSELEFPVLNARLAHLPRERLSYILESVDQQPWAVPLTSEQPDNANSAPELASVDTAQEGA
jgi:hypothetical protein